LRPDIKFDDETKMEYESDLMDLQELCGYFEHVIIAEVEPYVFVGSTDGEVLEKAKDLLRRVVGVLPQAIVLDATTFWNDVRRMPRRPPDGVLADGV
jgi:hypothetical protein